jgi:hypothetical protein
MTERILFGPGGASEASLQQLLAETQELNAKTPDVRTDFAAGRVRTAGGKVSVGSGSIGVFQLANPAGSSKILTLLDFTLATDSNADVTFRTDGTLSSPIAVEAFMPNRAYEGATTTVGIARQGGNGYSSPGRVLSPVYRLGANAPLQQPFTVVLLPGMSVSVSVQAAALGSMAFYCTGTWTEDPQ